MSANMDALLPASVCGNALIDLEAWPDFGRSVDATVIVMDLSYAAGNLPDTMRELRVHAPFRQPLPQALTAMS